MLSAWVVHVHGAMHGLRSAYAWERAAHECTVTCQKGVVLDLSRLRALAWGLSQVTSSQVKSSQVKSSHVKSSQVKSGRVESSHVT